MHAGLHGHPHSCAGCFGFLVVVPRTHEPGGAPRRGHKGPRRKGHLPYAPAKGHLPGKGNRRGGRTGGKGNSEANGGSGEEQKAVRKPGMLLLCATPALDGTEDGGDVEEWAEEAFEEEDEDLEPYDLDVIFNDPDARVGQGTCRLVRHNPGDNLGPPLCGQ